MNGPGESRAGLVVTGVGHRYGEIVAADGVDLEASPGEVHCLLGPSGSGKSTLLRLIAGLEPLQSGSISIAGRVVADGRVHEPPEARSVGFVFQDYALFPHLDARHNVAFGIDRGSRRERRRAAEAWLERVGLAEHAAAMPHTLSGGQQQRVALARALIREPEVMLLDEPFSGLDERLRADVRRFALELLRETGAATLMVTHDPREALLAGDRVSVLRAGRVLQTGTPKEVYQRSASRWVAEVFGPVNRLTGIAREGSVSSLWGPLDSAMADGKVEILIRPDALVLERPTGSTDGVVRGTVTAVTSTGALATVAVDLGGQRVEVQDFVRRGWLQGDEVDVALSPGAAMVRSRELGH